MESTTRHGFLTPYAASYGWGALLALGIHFIVWGLLLAGFCSVEAYRAHAHRLVQEQGTPATAMVTAAGKPRRAERKMTYQFRDLQGNLISDWEMIGIGGIEGKPFNSFRPGDTIKIWYLERDHSVSHIAGNESWLRGTLFPAVVFGAVWLIILPLFGHELRWAAGLNRLYKHGLQARGTVLSRTENTKGRYSGGGVVELQYVFTDYGGNSHMGKAYNRVGRFQEINVGGEVDILYLDGDPEKNTIRLL